MDLWRVQSTEDTKVYISSAKSLSGSDDVDDFIVA